MCCVYVSHVLCVRIPCVVCTYPMCCVYVSHVIHCIPRVVYVSHTRMCIPYIVHVSHVYVAHAYVSHVYVSHVYASHVYVPHALSSCQCPGFNPLPQGVGPTRFTSHRPFQIISPLSLSVSHFPVNSLSSTSLSSTSLSSAQAVRYETSLLIWKLSS